MGIELVDNDEILCALDATGTMLSSCDESVEDT